MTTREALDEAFSALDEACKGRGRVVDSVQLIAIAASLASGILIARAIEDSGVGAISGELENITSALGSK